MLLLSAKLKLKEISKEKHPFKIIRLCDIAIPNGIIGPKYIYNSDVKLSSKIYYSEDEGEYFRQDFLLVPREDIIELPDGSGFAIRTYNKQRKEFVKTMDDLRNKLVRMAINENSNVERFILNYGHEVFQIGGVDILTVFDKHCKKMCGTRFCANMIYRDYILSPILAGMIENSGISVVSIEYPCEYTNLSRIIRGFDTDPPKIKLVFPQKH